LPRRRLSRDEARHLQSKSLKDAAERERKVDWFNGKKSRVCCAGYELILTTTGGLIWTLMALMTAVQPLGLAVWNFQPDGFITFYGHR